jgi:protein-S-isoprenylcysteine O-methyltransferase Ste14
MTPKPDTAGVIAPPPLIALAALLIGIALQFFAPSSTLGVIPDWVRYFLAALLILMGGGLAWQGRREFGSAGTPVQPWRATQALVTNGVFAHVRNPMYSGMALLLVGIALLIANDWLVLTTIVCMLVIHFGVVLREERYLEVKFGEPYRAYKAHVPRYGWRP